MTTSTQRRADRLVRAERAFTRHIIEGASLDAVAAEVGVSRETIRRDVEAMKLAMGEDKLVDLDQRRAVRLAQLDQIRREALATFERFKKTKPLAAIGALNTAVSTFTHIRAIEGLDRPKESRIETGGTYTIKWADEGDED
jgi:hypothetical protein